MIDIPIKINIINHSKRLIKEINFGNRGFADGNKRQQYIGIVGENVIRDYLGIKLIEFKNEFDGGYDINWNTYKADVKTMERKVQPTLEYVNNVLDTQMNYQANAFIFCSINSKTKILTICGWITKKKFKELASYYPKGSTRKRNDNTTFELHSGNWEIKNENLYKFYKLDFEKNY